MSAPLILGTNSIKDVGYNVDNSLRFDDGSSDTLSINMSTSANRKTFTFSTWVKKTKITGTINLLGAGGSSDQNHFQYESSPLTFRHFNGSSNDIRVSTSRQFRDPSAWHHVILSVNTTQSTASDRVKIYVNGIEETSFAEATYPSQNYNFDFFQNGALTYIGRRFHSAAAHFDGYLAETVFVDGTALDATSFGEFDEDSGIWKPIDVSGLTFGTAGFYLDYKDSSALGNDVSGNDNDFTVNNLTSIDQSTDTCTLNYATMNPLDVPASNQPTFSEGNLKATSHDSAQGVTQNFGGTSTFALSSGKWYVEAKATVGAGGFSRNRIGITGNESTARLNNTLGANSYEYFYDSEAGNSNAGSYGDSYATGDIIGIYLDLDNNKLYFGKNGTIQNSGTGISIDSPSSTSVGGYKIAQSDSSGNASTTSTFEFNFGSPSYSISSSNTDPEGYGNFEYDPSSGTFDGGSKSFYAINTKNLAEYG